MKARLRPGFSILGPGFSVLGPGLFRFPGSGLPVLAGGTSRSPVGCEDRWIAADAGQAQPQRRLAIGAFAAANSAVSGPGRSDPRDPPCGLRQLDVDRGKQAGAILSAQGAELSPDSAFKPTLPKYHIENSGLEEVTEHKQIAG